MNMVMTMTLAMTMTMTMTMKMTIPGVWKTERCGLHRLGSPRIPT